MAGKNRPESQEDDRLEKWPNNFIEGPLKILGGFVFAPGIFMRVESSRSISWP